MNISNKKGIALFIALSLLLLISIGIIVFLVTSYNYANINESNIRRLRAMTLAEAGINYAYWKIRIDEDDGGVSPIVYPCTLTPPISVTTGWTIQVYITEDAEGHKEIRSTVTYPKTTVF